VDDFLFTESETAIHVINAASPAATAALNIGRILSDKITARF
jgi:L-2-hydroxyglutarate oxidase